MRILFITANRVGDAVLSTGVLHWLTEQYPDARFTIACGPFGANLFRATPRLEKLIILKKRRYNGHWIDLWKACIGKKWDLIVDLRNSAVSRLLLRKKLVTKMPAKGQHKVVELASILDITPPPTPHIFLDTESLQQANTILGDDSNHPVIALAPAANWPPKQWPIDRFTTLALRLTESAGLYPNARIAIFADKQEREQIGHLLRALPATQRIEIIGQPLLTAAACLSKCAIFIGNDSGLMHLAAAVGTPTLGLFGPGYENIYGPWGKHCAYVRTTEAREDLLKLLPDLSARSPNLMGGLTVDAVYQSLIELKSKP